jgi:hypothetical protein
MKRAYLDSVTARIASSEPWQGIRTFGMRTPFAHRWTALIGGTRYSGSVLAGCLSLMEINLLPKPAVGNRNLPACAPRHIGCNRNRSKSRTYLQPPEAGSPLASIRPVG